MSRLGALLGQPVVFQPLERELEPVAEYLSGKVLNAGCGGRDISAFLLSRRAMSVDNCDVTPGLPNAIVCNLETIPLPDAAYDSVLCNAVLEHIERPDRVMAELHRLLRPGGTLVVSVPFLQPFHAVPSDFRRYTSDGLSVFGRSQGFEVLTVLPVHSMAQTLAWIAWACLRERRRYLVMALCWLPFRLWTLLSQRTDVRLVNNANTYQIVFRKPQRSEPLQAEPIAQKLV
jgi:SAM-dependent methyltransferase